MKINLFFSVIFNPIEGLWVSHCLYNPISIFNVRPKVLHARIEYVLDTVLPQVKHWKNAEYFGKRVFSLHPHWFEIGNCVGYSFIKICDLKVKIKFYFPKLLRVFFIFKTNSLHLCCILQHKIYYCFRVVFWNMFSLSEEFSFFLHTILARWIIARARWCFFAYLLCFF